MAIQTNIASGVQVGAAFTPPSISQQSQVAYLIGYPIAHSSSPSLHKAISVTTSMPYAQALVESMDLPAFLTYLRNHPSSPKLLGSGVTMPHKVAVIPYLDKLTPEGLAVGAVNTIFLQTDPQSGQRLFVGHNTDTIGIRDAFVYNVPPTSMSSSRGRPGLVIGGGGTCRAAVYALQTFLGCSPIYIINRDKSEVDAVIEECSARGTAYGLVHVASLPQAEALEPPSLIVSAIPDFTPSTEGEQTVRQILSHFTRKSGSGALLEM